jgi:hypothetical protein
VQPDSHDEHRKGQHEGAVAPEGCWISQWKIDFEVDGTPYFIQGVLNDGTTLPPLSWIRSSPQETALGRAGGIFTDLHGRCVGSIYIILAPMPQATSISGTACMLVARLDAVPSSTCQVG